MREQIAYIVTPYFMVFDDVTKDLINGFIKALVSVDNQALRVDNSHDNLAVCELVNLKCFL